MTIITRPAFLKWSGITLVCGAHSFFWGYQATSEPVAMALGMLTLVLGFSFIESRAWYQKRRAAAPVMSRALDLGVKIRLYVAIYVLVSVILLTSLNLRQGVLNLPYAGEMYLGLVSAVISKLLTGIDVLNREAIAAPGYWLATYITTIITGFLHTVLLAILCATLWGIFKLQQRNRTRETPPL